MTGEKPKRNRSNNPGCALGFAIFWIAFSAIFLIIGIGDGNWAFIVFGGLFVLIGIGIGIYASLGLYTRFRIGKPIITFSSPTLRVGETLTMSYEHTLRQAVEIEAFTVELLFREVATYQQGTDTRTVTHNHVIDTIEQMGGRFQSGHIWHERFELAIPADGMHSLDVRRNKLKWIVKIQMTIPKLPNFVEEYEIIVLPEMVR